MAQLYDSFTLRSVTMRNRIGVSPMCQYEATDGMPGDWHFVHLGSRAVGGAGLVIAEATAVEPIGRISPGDLGIWSDAQGEAFARIARFIVEQGTTPGIQIAHAGRKASTSQPWNGDRSLLDSEGGWQPVAPSALPFGPESRMPRALTVPEIQQIQSRFVQAAGRCLAAGFQLLELHCAHGYLAHEFLSPLTNKRADHYGGVFENRIRFVVELVQSVRRVWPDELPLAVRFSCTDWVEGGWTLEETIDLAKRLKSEGVDLIDCSSGGAIPNVTIPSGAGYQTPFSEAIRNGADIATAAVGFITSPMQADEVIRNGRADMVFLAREMLRDPYWAIHGAIALRQPKSASIPRAYLRAF